jgi:hypothetical protein
MLMRFLQAAPLLRMLPAVLGAATAGAPVAACCCCAHWPLVALLLQAPAAAQCWRPTCWQSIARQECVIQHMTWWQLAMIADVLAQMLCKCTLQGVCTRLCTMLLSFGTCTVGTLRKPGASERIGLL